MEATKRLDASRNQAVILNSGHTLVGRISGHDMLSITLSPEDDPEGLILIPWNSVLYIVQESESKVIPHG